MGMDLLLLVKTLNLKNIMEKHMVIITIKQIIEILRYCYYWLIVKIGKLSHYIQSKLKPVLKLMYWAFSLCAANTIVECIKNGIHDELTIRFFCWSLGFAVIVILLRREISKRTKPIKRNHYSEIKRKLKENAATFRSRRARKTKLNFTR